MTGQPTRAAARKAVRAWRDAAARADAARALLQAAVEDIIEGGLASTRRLAAQDAADAAMNLASNLRYAADDLERNWL